MALRHKPQIHSILRWLTIGLGASSFALIMYAFTVPTGESLEGRLLPSHLRKEQEWVTISADQARQGVTLPSHSNVIIHIPEEVTRITRRTLFGRKGDQIKYWGYCFPEDYDQAQALRRRGFPGVLFLSEKEQEERDTFQLKNRKEAFSVTEDLDEDELNRTRAVRGTIRHQMEIFTGGQSCYIMTEEPLPIGTDNDGDGVNIAVERDYGSDPNNADSDGDGIRDGLEIFQLLSMPTRRDTDGDGLIDGIEDADRDGRVDERKETNPREWDSDRDGLCDGLCLVNKGSELRGEDKNLNGILDKDETDPRKKDTDGDGILDEQEYFNCLLRKGKNC